VDDAFLAFQGHSVSNMRRDVLLSVVKEAYAEWNSHNAAQLGASLAYYSVLSLAPLIVLLLAILGLAYGAEAAHGKLFMQLEGFMGSGAAEAVQQVVVLASQPASGIIATAISLITLLFGASGVVIALQQTLNTIWDVPARPTHRWWAPYLRQKLIAFGAVVAVGFLLVIMLAITTGIAVAEKFFSAWLPLPGASLQLLNFVVSVAITTFLFAFLFRFLPDRRIAWRRVWVGATATASLFTLGKWLIGLYLGKASVGSAYGAAGSLIVVLVWVYYSAQVFFFGAEFTHVYAKAQAAHARDRSRTEALTPPASAPSVHR
jgi:membrane protein